MMAGHSRALEKASEELSVRPKFKKERSEDIMANEGESDEGEGEGKSEEGEEAGKIKLPREEEVVRKLVDPLLPTKAEVDTHNVMGHIPFRNWCPICVKAQGRDWDHGKDKGRERTLLEYSWDYCFPGDEFGYKWTVLVGRERQAKSWMASAAPSKGLV